MLDCKILNFANVVKYAFFKHMQQLPALKFEIEDGRYNISFAVINARTNRHIVTRTCI